MRWPLIKTRASWVHENWPPFHAGYANLRPADFRISLRTEGGIKPFRQEQAEHGDNFKDENKYITLVCDSRKEARRRLLVRDNAMTWKRISHYWPFNCDRNQLSPRGLPSQRVSNAELWCSPIKQLTKESRCRWFETPRRSCHYNEISWIF